MSERKMAHIEKILDLQPIPKADAIEVATVLGWKVVCKKGEFKVGDLAIYLEIDSWVPTKIAPFLSKGKEPREYNGIKGERLKSIKLKKQLSQGLLLKIEDIFKVVGDQVTVIEGQDVTEQLCIQKWEMEIPAQMAGKIKGNFPTHIIHKTDQTRIQAEPGLINEFTGKECYIAIKVDGTSSTYASQNGELHVCSRNLSLQEDESNVYWKMFHKYHIGDIMAKEGNIGIQGEVAGPGIQKNPLGLKEVELFVFDVYDTANQKYYAFDEMMNFCEKNGLQTVPIQQVTVFNYTLEQLLELSKGKYPNTNNDREGIVIRPTMPIYSETLKGRLSVKVINNDYLLKQND